MKWLYLMEIPDNIAEELDVMTKQQTKGTFGILDYIDRVLEQTVKNISPKIKFKFYSVLDKK